MDAPYDPVQDCAQVVADLGWYGESVINSWRELRLRGYQTPFITENWDDIQARAKELSLRHVVFMNPEGVQ